jgi:signal transduction histidine kinase
MDREQDFTNSEDLTFFAKVNASISHELKNVMAIISETSGLLQDLTEMARTGQKIDLEMVTDCSRDIAEEIQRGFVTIKQMNRFAHSADDPVKKVNLAEVVELMVSLAGYLSMACRVELEAENEAPPEVLTCPFRFENLIYRLLLSAFESAGPGGRIRLAVRRKPDGEVQIQFGGLEACGTGTIVSAKARSLAASIGVEIRETEGSSNLELRVPANFEKQA